MREVLETVFAANPRLRGYLLDNQGALREQVTIFVDGARDRVGLSDSLASDAKIYVKQALSGG